MMPQALFTSNSRMIKFRRVLAVLCFSLLLILVVGVTQKLFERKYSYSKYYDFYQQEEDFDVLFLGTSHVINAVYPMELWRGVGVVSFNIGKHFINIRTN